MAEPSSGEIATILGVAACGEACCPIDFCPTKVLLPAVVLRLVPAGSECRRFGPGQK
jgi:hypothetical protein